MTTGTTRGLVERAREISDLGSGSGLLVDGKLVVQARITSGSAVRVGNTTLRVWW